MTHDRAILTEELLAVWCRELVREWHTCNRDFLAEALAVPQVELASTATATLGTWDRNTRRIRISLRHVLEDPWTTVLETLRHEMAHQFADEVLKAHEEPPHGRAFGEACRRLRIDARARVPLCERTRVQTDSEESPPESKIVITIRKLLALGTSDNENEAAAAMRKARILLHKHKLDLADLDAREGFDRRVLGTFKARHSGWEYTRARILTDYFYVTAIWIPSYDVHTQKRGSVLEIHGRRGDVALASWVHDWLEDTIDRLWRRYRRDRRLPGNTERRRYLEGLLQGFHDKLAAEAKPGEPGGALVQVRDAELEAHFRWLYPRIRNVTRTTRTTRAYHDGVRDGSEIELRRPLGREERAHPRELPGS
ncbi:MAG: DUF2786 domain-containing protein [Planctomycetes bacterium]|nr:DUF2786 domain-containing protein [Planctomycetota bacterium]MCB9917963.1 DUF2786 domain-containing protein [Planctomycetota bacterium]